MNILVLMSDEHQARALGCAGHPVVDTPNLDRLAARGTRFTNAWTPSPICVPARAAFATGRWVHETGAWDSAQAYAGSPRSWAHDLRDAGYDVASIGKLHHRSATDDDGFGERILPMFIAGGVGWLQGLPRRDPLPYDEAGELAADVGVGETTYTRYDARVTGAAVDWLSQRARQQTPWCAFVSLVAPHYPLSAPQEFSDRYPLSEVPPPEIASMGEDHPAVSAMADFFNYGDYFGPQTVAEARRAYFGLCSWMDHNVGRVLDAVAATGALDNTLVIYTSDHGEMAGNRGLWCKSFLYRDSVDVPMILAGPDVPAGQTVATRVNLTDVAATVRAAAGLQPQGQDLIGIANGSNPDRLGFSEYHDGGSITGSFALALENWKYIEHVGHRPQLFDVAADPDELHDLGSAPELQPVRDRCYEALRSIADPERVNQQAFEAQDQLLAAHGGRRGVATAFRFNHTPIPGDT